MNTAEHGWAKLEKYIYMLHPEVEFFKGNKEQLKKKLYEAIEDTLKSLDDNCFDPLIRCMESYVDAVLEAMKWYTCY